MSIPNTKYQAHPRAICRCAIHIPFFSPGVSQAAGVSEAIGDTRATGRVRSGAFFRRLLGAGRPWGRPPSGPSGHQTVGSGQAPPAQNLMGI